MPKKNIKNVEARLANYVSTFMIKWILGLFIILKMANILAVKEINGFGELFRGHAQERAR